MRSDRAPRYGRSRREAGRTRSPPAPRRTAGPDRAPPDGAPRRTGARWRRRPGPRARGRFDDARTAIRRRTQDPAEARDRFLSLARRDYERVLAALPEHSFVTFGNVDIPDLLRSLLPDGIRFVDAEAVRLGAMAFGFVGGGVRTPLAIPGEVPDEEYDAK